MKIQEWLGEDNKLGIDIWTNKYQKDGDVADNDVYCLGSVGYVV